jgi:hypothetical protein
MTKPCALSLSLRKDNPTRAVSPSSYSRTRALCFLCTVSVAQTKLWCYWPAIMESASVTNHVSLICPSIEVLKPRSWLQQTDRRDLGFRTSTDASNKRNKLYKFACCVRASVEVLKPRSRLSVFRSQDLGFRTSIDGQIKETLLVTDADFVTVFTNCHWK